MAPFKKVLQERIHPEDQLWSFFVEDLPNAEESNKKHLVKFISVTSNQEKQELSISLILCPVNRVTSADSLDKFVLMSFKDFRLRTPSKENPSVTVPASARESSAYISRILKGGIMINGTTYHFYGHSNSQLKSRSCFMFGASKDEIRKKVEDLGDFSKIKTVAKKAKRIGLLFSTTEMGVKLQPDRCEDIPDIQSKDYNFTDGCGLISVLLARQLDKKIPLSFRNLPYMPSVYQIRYRGYKGVLTLEPALPKQILVQFRDSMRKFKGATDLMLFVVDHSKPYAFGYLNDEVVLLLHALGVLAEVLLSKQRAHLEFLTRVSQLDPRLGFQFLCSLDRLEFAERLLLEGIEAVGPHIQKLVRDERAKLLDKRGGQRCRILVQSSRLLFGICDPKDVLKEGECFVRITHDNDGQPRTLTNAEVLVTRNPCLHPGDLQKFRAVDRPELAHLKDCIIFPTRGKRPSADLMSGGDLDGDKFFVCWDPDLIPSSVAEPAEYPGGKEPVSFGGITDEDRINYFAGYTSASLGQVKNLFLDWARLKGPMSSECQQLNRLFSQCVDGNRIKVPDFLKDPPKPDSATRPFILDVLHDSSKFINESKIIEDIGLDDYPFDAMQLLLSRDHLSLSEFEIIRLTIKWCHNNSEDFAQWASFFDFTALSDEEKAWTLAKLPTSPATPSLVLNGLMQSSILTSADVSHFRLHYPALRWKRVFDSNLDRIGTFLDRTSNALELFHKKLIVLRLDERLAIAIYVPNKVERHLECQVDDSVRVFAFPQSQGSQSSQYRVMPTKVNYRLFSDGSVFQLYNNRRADTWVFLTHGPSDDSSYRNEPSKGNQRRQKQKTVDDGVNSECRASIALNKISSIIQKHVGRVNRQAITGAEIYVISNRDTKSLQLLDLWLDFVDTQKVIPRFEQEVRKYSVSKLDSTKWENEPEHIIAVVRDRNLDYFQDTRASGIIKKTLKWLMERNERTRMVEIYEYLSCASRPQGSKQEQEATSQCLLSYLLDAPFATKKFFDSDLWEANAEALDENIHSLGPELLSILVLSGSSLGTFILEPIKIVLSHLKQLRYQKLHELIKLITLTIRSPELALDILLELLDPQMNRLLSGNSDEMYCYTRRLYGVALDHIDEAAESVDVREDLINLEHKYVTDGYAVVEARLRIDAPSTSSLRTGDHVRLVVASAPENAPLQPLSSVDAIVETSKLGSATFRCLHELPIYFRDCSWKIQPCGSFVSTGEMLKVLTSFYAEKDNVCRIYSNLTGSNDDSRSNPDEQLSFSPDPMLNESQNRALAAAMTTKVTLLWGPPGTGKTRTVVEILQQLLQAAPTKRIMVAAPTHNAVDNVLRKFVELDGPLKTNTIPIRVSTDVRKVSEDLKKYTCDAMVGKDLNANPESRRKAQKRIKDCRLVFTTCIGANLGLLRGESFQIVLVDEASQQSEAMTLAPLVKGCERTVLVGDHVQLRATTGQHAQLVDFDVSLFERLYKENLPGISKVMLDMQYRMHQDICSFSSKEFYGDRLLTAVRDTSRPLPPSSFPWPEPNVINLGRNVFLQCSDPEDLGRKSKCNSGQADVCRQVCRLLKTPPPSQASPEHSIIVLTPYTRQIDLLRTKLEGVEVFSIDGFQGREADIIIFVTVRCNARKEMGFLKDMRRLNVAMTRAKTGVIVIGDRVTLCEGEDPSNEVWGRLVKSCVRVELEKPEVLGALQTSAKLLIRDQKISRLPKRVV